MADGELLIADWYERLHNKTAIIEQPTTISN